MKILGNFETILTSTLIRSAVSTVLTWEDVLPLNFEWMLYYYWCKNLQSHDGNVDDSDTWVKFHKRTRIAIVDYMLT